MIISTPTSLGELIDKISILQIKKKNIQNTEKQKLINNEINLLNDILKNVLGENKEIHEYLNKLIIINSKLWAIEDNLRVHERNKTFNKEFIELARSVYLNNDERAKIKLELNKKYGSQIIEVKSYEKY